MENSDAPLIEFLITVLNLETVHPKHRVEAGTVLVAYHKKFGNSWKEDAKETIQTLRNIALTKDFALVTGAALEPILEAQIVAAFMVLR